MQLDSPVKTSFVELPKTTVSKYATEATKQIDLPNFLPNSARQNVNKTDVKSNETGGQITVNEIDSQVANINAQLQKLQNYLKFERDKDSDRMVIFVKDKQTDEVLRQIPTEEFLAISKNINQYLEISKPVSEKNSSPIGMFTNETV